MKKALFFILTILLLTNCKQLENMNDNYEWLVETGADKGYPMEILSGSFIYENEAAAGIPGGMRLGLGSWWLSSNSGTIISGEQFRPIPVKMEIEWYSYAEDKFYTGSFKLDQQKLLEYFRKGHTNCVKKEVEDVNFDFLIGLAPGGQVYLYLSGANRILVHQFKGQEIQVSNFKEVMRYNTDETRDEIFKDFAKSMPKQTQQEIVEKRISTDIWDKLNQKYHWKLTWEMKDTPSYKLNAEFLGSDFINAESIYCTPTDYFTNAEPKPVPYEMLSNFKSPAGRAFTLYTYFGYVNGVEPAKQDYETHRKREQEMVQLFKDFSEKIGGKEFELHIKFDENLKTAKAYLKYDKTEQQIPFAVFEFYSNE
ncbi:DUF2931 family protein [Chryseobacterium binzhouense]|uniref:DUF2931 family protein n=1 Tax=Chryseobacterium binzhouense TaxID=2593646 RepID=UPI0028A20E3A|nr:DUF2931 family protein [Chryseobacterium binzhouense]